MKKIMFLATVLFAVGATAQTTTVGTTSSTTNVQGTNININGGADGTTRIKGGTGGVEIGSNGRNTNIIGATTNINTSNTNITSAGSVNINTSTLKLTGSQSVTGNLTVNQTISSSQAIQTTGTGSIHSAYNLSAASNKFKVSGDNGNVTTTGSITATTGNFGGAGVGAGLVGVGAGNKIVLNGNNGNATISGVALLTGGAYVELRADGNPALTVNGQGSFKGIDNEGQKITGVGNGVNADDAVNKGQLDFLENNFRLDIKEVYNNLDLTNTKLNKAESDIVNLQETKADKVQVEKDIAKAKSEAITSANTYTDTKVSNLDKKLTTEVSRLDKRIDATETKVSDLTKVVSDNKAEAKAYTDALDTKVTKEVARLDGRIDDETNRAKEAERELRTDLSLESRRARLAEGAITNEMMGIAAMSAAMSAANGSQIYNSEKRGNLSFGTGFYGNAKAFAAGFSYFVSPNAKVSANVASGSNTRAAAAGIGFSIGF